MGYPLTHKQFYEGLKNDQLLGLKCHTCGEITAPPRMCCPHCGEEGFEIVELKCEGIIKTFTIVRVSPQDFPAPQIVALAEMADGPWLIGNIEGLDVEEATMDLIGKKVKLEHKVIPAFNYSGGEGIAAVFRLVSGA